MGFSKAGGSVLASTLALTMAVAPVMQSETMVEAATKVKLNKTEVDLVVGKSTKIKLKGAKAVKFESSDKKIAKVTKSGKIKAKKAGSCTIKVYDSEGNVYKCKVTVTKKGQKTTDNSNIDLGGMEIIIRDWWSPEDPGDPTNDYEEALNDYHEEIMKKYNFKIKQVAISDWGSCIEDFVVYTMCGGDDTNYVFTLRDDPALTNAMYNGLMYDLSKLDCLDFSSEKFTRNMLHDKYSVGNSIYACYAGISEPREGVFFNKKVLKEAGIDPDDIYEAQKNGTWTWDMFEELMDKCQRDTDGDGIDDVYGLAVSDSYIVAPAVFSNGGSFIKKDKNGKFVNNVKSDETIEALKWSIDILSKYADHRPEDAAWDYYLEDFGSGETAFCIDQEYQATGNGRLFYDYDLDLGFVMFPKGPSAKNYVSLWTNNPSVIPACYDAERAWKIAFAWNLWTEPIKGYEDYNEYVIHASQMSRLDEKAISETIPMMSDSKYGKVYYHDMVPGTHLGADLSWNINPGTDLKELVKECKSLWDEYIAEVNKQIK